MKARWRARVSASYRADGCSSASRQSRMILKTVTALALRLVRPDRRAGTPPLSLRAPCQSEIKRTLRRGERPPNTACIRRIFACSRGSFDADGERQVSSRPPSYGFEMVDAPRDSRFHAARIGINRKFTPNQISRIFRKFSRDLTSMQTLAIYPASVSHGSIAGSSRNGIKETTGVARCFFCFAWHSGSGWCSCCCRGTRRLNRTSCRRSARPKRCRLRPRRCRT